MGQDATEILAARRRPRCPFPRYEQRWTMIWVAATGRALEKEAQMDERVETFLATSGEHRRRFEAFCRSLTAAELAAPVPDTIWMVNGYIAHLATIDVVVTDWFSTLADAQQAGVAQHQAGADAHAGFDVDHWNETQVAARADWPLDRILAEMALNRASLERVVQRFASDVVDGLMYFPGDRDRPPTDVPVASYLVGLALHDPIHAIDMIRALPHRATDGQLASWLDPIAQLRAAR